MSISSSFRKCTSAACRVGATRMVLSRRVTVIARAISIMLVMMHNLVHIFPTVAKECEFNFNPGLNAGFFARVRWDNPLLAYDFLSFIGWYGVPVFIFLSGFGLARRYDGAESFDAGSFLSRNWRKLFFLMLPAVMIFCLEYLMGVASRGEAVDAMMMGRMLMPLTELNGLFERWLPVVPGVYWYLGLAFELYAVYALAIHRRPAWVMWSVAAVCYIGLSVMVSSPFIRDAYEWVEYLRHNFTGWMLPFVAGVAMGRRGGFPLYALGGAFVAALAWFVCLMDTPFGWQATALAAVVVVLSLALVVDKVPALSSFMGWMGGLSAFIYIVHPIVRYFLGRYFFDFYSRHATPTLRLCLLYFVLVVASAIVYRAVCRYLPRCLSGLRPFPARNVNA